MQRQTSGPASANVSVFELIGDSGAISSADGALVYERVADALRHGETIVVSFAKIEMVSTAFLTEAIGRLYGEFDEELIREKLRVEDAKAGHLVLLEDAIEGAKDYFADPEGYEADLSKALNE